MVPLDQSNEPAPVKFPTPIFTTVPKIVAAPSRPREDDDSVRFPLPRVLTPRPGPPAEGEDELEITVAPMQTSAPAPAEAEVQTLGPAESQPMPQVTGSARRAPSRSRVAELADRLLHGEGIALLIAVAALGLAGILWLAGSIN